MKQEYLKISINSYMHELINDILIRQYLMQLQKDVDKLERHEIVQISKKLNIIYKKYNAIEFFRKQS